MNEMGKVMGSVMGSAMPPMMNRMLAAMSPEDRTAFVPGACR